MADSTTIFGLTLIRSKYDVIGLFQYQDEVMIQL